MTLQEIKDLKDKIYEIEGLLELAQLREDKISELEPLIRERINALNEKTDVSEPPADADEYSENIDNAIDEEIEETQPELEEMEELEEEEELKLEEPEEEPKAAPAYPQPTGVITELFEENDTVSVSRDADDLEIPEIEDTADEDYVEEYEIGDDEFEKKPEKIIGHNPHTTKPAFTLNDRFRFRRELFGNSDAEYSSAMDLIASMDSYEEAEEYFLDELGWSLENPEVKDFMDIIQKYFA